MITDSCPQTALQWHFVLLHKMSWEQQNLWRCPVFYLRCPQRAGLPGNLDPFCRMKTCTIHPLLALPSLHGVLQMLLKLLEPFSAFTSCKENTISFTCSLLEQFFQVKFSQPQLAFCSPAWVGRTSCLLCELVASLAPCAGWGQDEGGWYSTVNFPFPVIIMGCITECNICCRFQNNWK